MSDLEFSRRDAEDLARKLDSAELRLSDKERVLLLAIFSAASGQVRRGDVEGADPGEPTLTDLREQLVKAFVPEEAPKYRIAKPIIEPPP